jgi:hypothetical protein
MDRDPKMVPLNRVTRLCALTFTMLMSLAAARAQGPPEGSGLGASCPEPMGNFFGHFVMTDAIAFVAGRNREEKKEKTCWVAGPSASGQNRVESQSGEDAMAAEYSYTISAAGISAAAKVSGQHNSDHGGGGSGVSMLWLMWHDTLTFHSSQIPLVDPNDYRRGHPPTPEQLVEQMIHFKVKLLQSPPQCSGLKEPEFHYLTAVAAVVVDIGGGKGDYRSWRGPARSHIRELAPARGYLRHPRKFRHCPGTQRPKRGRAHHCSGEPAGQY